MLTAARSGVPTGCVHTPHRFVTARFLARLVGFHPVMARDGLMLGRRVGHLDDQLLRVMLLSADDAAS
jgi:hypothetical protein